MSFLKHPFLLRQQTVSLLLVLSTLFWLSCSSLWFTCYGLRHTDLAVCIRFSTLIANFGNLFFGKGSNGNSSSNELLGAIALTTLFASTGSYIILFFFRGERSLSQLSTTSPSSDEGQDDVPNKRKNPMKNVGKGNPNVRLWTHLIVTVPFFIVSFHPLWDYWDDIKEDGMRELVGDIANPTGIGAIVALSWFMVPVARQSPLLVALGVNPVHALYFHIWAGRLCLVGSFLHTLCYIIIYVDGNEDATKTWLKVVLTVMFPPKACWIASMPWNHANETELLAQSHQGGGKKQGGGEKQGEHEMGGGEKQGEHEMGGGEKQGEHGMGGGEKQGGHGMGEHGMGEHGMGEHGMGEHGMGGKLNASEANEESVENIPNNHNATEIVGHESGGPGDQDTVRPSLHHRSLVSKWDPQLTEDWHKGGVWLPALGDEDWSTSRILQHGHGHGTSCYGYWRNFTGLISVSALILLVLLSLNWIRRKYYKFFYISHIILGSTMLFFALVHWHRMSAYLLPTLLYYFACTIPSIVQMVATFFNGGSCLQKTTFLAKSGGCAEIVLSKGRHAAEMEIAESGLYVRLCVPELSLMWHPFTVASTADDSTKLKILFRKYGSFTTKFYNRLRMTDKPPPKILVDAFYGGGTDWATRALGHDAVLLVAGGIGVTPFLSMISLLHSSIANSIDNRSSPHTLRRVEFHWYSRDEGLARFVLDHHLSLLTNSDETLKLDNNSDDGETCKFEIVIHFTQRDADQELPFTLGQDISSTSSTAEVGIADSPPEDSAEETDLESDPTADVLISYPITYGSDVDIARFNVSRSYRYIRNFPSLLIFEIICVIGTALIWKQEANPPDRSSVMVRAHTLYWIIFTSLFVGIVAEICWRLHHKLFPPTSQEFELISSVRDPEGNNTDGDKAFIKKLDLPHESVIEGRVSLSIRAENGRPIVNNVVHGILDGTDSPGVFLCGPETLLSQIKKVCCAERGGKWGCSSSTVKFYEEHFEM